MQPRQLTARRQEWEWQLEELALYFLLWSEGANLRHLPECLWFHYWILRNSHMRMAEVCFLGGSVLISVVLPKR